MRPGSRRSRRPAATRGPRAAPGSAWATVRKLALALPGVDEGTSYGTPAFHVRRKFLLRLKEDGQSIAIRMDFVDRDVLMQIDPETFYITDHYTAYPAMLVRLTRVKAGQLKEVIERAWRFTAPPSLVKALDAGRSGKAGTPRKAGSSGQ
jgi:hypothetical protein